MDDVLIRATAMLAVACYVGRLLIDAGGSDSATGHRLARRLWTLGALMLTAHVACALHFRHHWSQAAAWEHTRLRTLATTGWDSGAGLLVNYVMALTWLGDAAAWNLRTDWPQRHRGWYRIVQAFFAFLMFNATAVFGSWYWQPATAMAAAAIVWLALRHRAATPAR